MRQPLTKQSLAWFSSADSNIIYLIVIGFIIFTELTLKNLHDYCGKSISWLKPYDMKAQKQLTLSCECYYIKTAVTLMCLQAYLGFKTNVLLKACIPHWRCEGVTLTHVTETCGLLHCGKSRSLLLGCLLLVSLPNYNINIIQNYWSPLLL